MKNYWLKGHMERNRQKTEWKPFRIQILEEFIKTNAYFSVDLEHELSSLPSWFAEEDILHQCLNETYDIQAAKSHVFMHLYTNASQQANAIGLLIKTSHQAGWQLWRTLYEAHIVCEFLAQYCGEHPQVFRGYISSTLLRSWIRGRESYNKLCGRSGRDPHYDETVISHMKLMYKEKFGSRIQDYVWANSVLQKGPNYRVSFADMSNKIDDDMKIFYRITSEEVHPTLGHKFALLTTSLPLLSVPMMPGRGPFSYQEMSLDYLTARVLRQITIRVPDFLNLDGKWRARWTRLSKIAEDVLDKLKQ